MSVVKSSFVALLLFAANLVIAQTGSDTLLAKDNVMIPLPTISINFGINNSFSDVKLGSAGRIFGNDLTIGSGSSSNFPFLCVNVCLCACARACCVRLGSMFGFSYQRNVIGTVCVCVCVCVCTRARACVSNHLSRTTTTTAPRPATIYWFGSPSSTLYR